jgi:hypothetical protein
LNKTVNHHGLKDNRHALRQPRQALAPRQGTGAKTGTGALRTEALLKNFACSLVDGHACRVLTDFLATALMEESILEVIV